LEGSWGSNEHWAGRGRPQLVKTLLGLHWPGVPWSSLSPWASRAKPQCAGSHGCTGRPPRGLSGM
jgi:hypothetical protein